MFFQLSKQLIFPHPSLADEDGLLAVGGDLSVERLMLAYQNGIFPWYSEGEPILWHSPHKRFVIFTNEIHISHSMKQLMRSGKYRVTYDTAFEEVITNCAKIKRPGQRGTWITRDMKDAYIRLHKQGFARSVEVWQGETLAGGLYGVEVGHVFCGESMFSKMPNASKVALITLCQSGQYDVVDCQTYTPHLETMGARFIDRAPFLDMLIS